MLGVVDVGGGMRGSFTAGIYDYIADQGVQPFDYCLGVSAGSANLVSYLAGQRGRNYRFYTEYAFRERYMSMKNMARIGSYVDLDYVYDVLSGPGGEDPVDLEVFGRNAHRYQAVVTDAASGHPVYYDGTRLTGGNFDPVKASCCVPGACKPCPVDGVPGFDGGVADPIPYRHALDMGCDRLVVLLTRPAAYHRPPLDHQAVMQRMLANWPNSFGALKRRYVRYNTDLEAVKELQAEGKALLVAPKSIAGMSTLTKDHEAVERLYRMGYRAGEQVLAFARGETVRSETEMA